MTRKTRKIRIEGAKELNQAIAKYGEKAKQEARNVTVRTAFKIHQYAVKSVSESGTGTVYYRMPGDKYMTIRAGDKDGPPVAFVPGGGGHNLSRVHKASAEGKPPAVDTGRLRTSLVWKMDGDGALIGSTIKEPPYPMWLEFGTRNMAARPFMQPALDAHKKLYLDQLKEIHDRAAQ